MAICCEGKQNNKGFVGLKKVINQHLSDVTAFVDVDWGG
jgi:hypothetical protein